MACESAAALGASASCVPAKLICFVCAKPAPKNPGVSFCRFLLKIPVLCICMKFTSFSVVLCVLQEVFKPFLSSSLNPKLDLELLS